MSAVLLAAVFWAAGPLSAASIFISPGGNDSTGDGSLGAPFRSISRAESAAAPGDTVVMRGGIYKGFGIAASTPLYHFVHNLTRSGITYAASKGEIPVFDFSGIPDDKRVAAFRIAGSCDVTFNGPMEVRGVPVGTQKQSECFRIEGTARFNRVSCHDNAAIGFYFTGHGRGACHRCDAYNNIGTTGASIGNIDGFGAHGDGVIFTECRAWNCSDDGYDCISSAGANTFDRCWAFGMTAGGDSNGFKIGGWGRNNPRCNVPVHTVRYCLAAKNNAHGFYANHQPGQSAIWTNNTAFSNRHGNFNMLECAGPADPTDIPGTREVLHGNISFGGILIEKSNLSAANETNNSWTKSGIKVSARDFLSTDASQLAAPRQSDGSLPVVTFMHPVPGSALRGLGCFQSPD